MAGELGVAFFLVPDAHGPIIGASDEDWAVVRVPVGIATDTVDGSHVAIVVVGVPLREGG